MANLLFINKISILLMLWSFNSHSTDYDELSIEDKQHLNLLPKGSSAEALDSELPEFLSNKTLNGKILRSGGLVNEMEKIQQAVVSLNNKYSKIKKYIEKCENDIMHMSCSLSQFSNDISEQSGAVFYFLLGDNIQKITDKLGDNLRQIEYNINIAKLVGKLEEDFRIVKDIKKTTKIAHETDFPNINRQLTFFNKFLSPGYQIQFKKLFFLMFLRSETLDKNFDKLINMLRESKREIRSLYNDTLPKIEPLLFENNKVKILLYPAMEIRHLLLLVTFPALLRK